ncbi:uncharacterized protein [Elaeis guineensis]|uniref:uncharacterized protein isoform X2 n=1 Tax=Elaeis guineensis var. tenera TaxID=51953 RepID=UPI003C6CFD2A
MSFSFFSSSGGVFFSFRTLPEAPRTSTSSPFSSPPPPAGSAVSFLPIITGVGLPLPISVKCFLSQRDPDLLPVLLAATSHRYPPSPSSPSSPASAFPSDLPQICADGWMMEVGVV